MLDGFFPVRLNTIRPDETITFDLYLKLSTRYVHYIHCNEELEGERQKKLKSHGVRKVFIRTADEDAYLSYLENGLSTLKDQSLDISTKGSIAHDSLITAAENAERVLETESGFNKQKKQFEKVSEFLASEKGALKSVLQSAGISVDNNHHAATVSSLCLAVATKAGIEDKTEIFELGIAALLHDIGKNRLKFNYMKPWAQFTPDEQRQYKNHPQDGADMLAGKPYINPRILGLIAAHEEKGEGRGYPEKVNLFKKPLSYQILSMVNAFDHFCFEENILPNQAIDPFFEKHGQFFDESLISVLATVLT
ncbi:HD-GYP domain-containing protein [Peredibacter sp. HCB2-198]|uniref:HD-GYP domain-containing protein n=1 Tax=Peredibacter sp. HCB2-198 TaxID=3383025 RepID=UPI0038B67CCB